MTTTMWPRPDEKPEVQRAERGWLPVVWVLASLLVIVVGGYVTAGALSEPAGPPMRVARVVQIQPLSGWSFAERGTVCPGGPQFARLTRGGGSIDVAAYPGAGGTAEELAITYRRELEQCELTRLSVSSSLEPVRTASGLQGVRFTYSGLVPKTGTSIDGEVTVIVSSAGNGAAFDGWAPAGLLSYASGDINTMIDEAVVA
ncbi:MAG: hypothetical protein ABI828_05115 [Actinomycetota bacterium]